MAKEWIAVLRAADARRGGTFTNVVGALPRSLHQSPTGGRHACCRGDERQGPGAGDPVQRSFAITERGPSWSSIASCSNAAMWERLAAISKSDA